MKEREDEECEMGRLSKWKPGERDAASLRRALESSTPDNSAV
jgi:hypothetical protein